MQASTSTVTNNDTMMDIHTMLLHLCSKSEEPDVMKAQINSNVQRLDRLEAKLGNPEEIVVPLSLTIRGLRV